MEKSKKSKKTPWKQESWTDRNPTKCRIVFAAGGKNSEGVSLNSILLPGPKR